MRISEDERYEKRRKFEVKGVLTYFTSHLFHKKIAKYVTCEISDSTDAKWLILPPSTEYHILWDGYPT